MPPRRSEPVSFGANGSDTSYCCSSPVPQHETYRNLSSRLRLMSVTRGGTALKGFRAGGSSSSAAGSAGIVMTLRTPHLPSLSRYHVQIADDRSASETTVFTKPYVLLGSCDGRSSRTICCSAPRSSDWRCLRDRRSHTWS